MKCKESSDFRARIARKHLRVAVRPAVLVDRSHRQKALVSSHSRTMI